MYASFKFLNNGELSQLLLFISWFLLTEPCFMVVYFLSSTFFFSLKHYLWEFFEGKTDRPFILPGTWKHWKSGPIWNYIEGLGFPWPHKQGKSFQIWARVGPWPQLLMDFFFLFFSPPVFFPLDQYKFPSMFWG